MITAAEQLERLRFGMTDLEPLSFAQVALEDAAKDPGRPRADATIAVRYRDRQYIFVVECKARSTPKILAAAVAAARALADPPRTYPMIMVPYLSRLSSETWRLPK